MKIFISIIVFSLLASCQMGGNETRYRNCPGIYRMVDTEGKERIYLDGGLSVRSIIATIHSIERDNLP